LAIMTAPITVPQASPPSTISAQTGAGRSRSACAGARAKAIPAMARAGDDETDDPAPGGGADRAVRMPPPMSEKVESIGAMVGPGHPPGCAAPDQQAAERNDEGGDAR
jgi:hypothetical protein